MTDIIAAAFAGRLGNFALDVAFEAPMRGITALFGPSGCGKTSILRCFAGLQRLPGSVVVGEEIWQDERRFVPAHKRAVGYVLQEASLFPHLSVRGNLLYGYRRAGSGRHAIELDEVVDLLGLAGLIERDPSHLSGGERQRVSIGRALLSQPRLLLMDEPLSALDRTAKDEILPYFEALHARLSIPILYVTHDLTEVERLADHLVVLAAGRVASAGPLNASLTAVSSPLGGRRDLASVLPATVMAVEADGIAALDVEGTPIYVIASPGLAPGQPVRVRVAASDISIARERPAASSILNAVEATITAIEPLGTAEVNVHLALREGAGAGCVARISRRSLERLALHPGERVIAQIKGVSLLASR